VLVMSIVFVLVHSIAWWSAVLKYNSLGAGDQLQLLVMDLISCVSWSGDMWWSF
jgi:hypothetical protein